MSQPSVNTKQPLPTTLHIVIVRVGNEQNYEDFHVSEARLRACSPFFNAALSQMDHEPAPVVKLQQFTPDIFKDYLRWIQPFTGEGALEIPKMKLGRLVRDYTLGEILQDDAFCNSLMNTLVDVAVSEMTIRTLVSYINFAFFIELSKGSRLRKLLVNIARWKFPKLIYEDPWRGKLPPEFWVSLSQANMESHDFSSAFEARFDHCRYHIYDNEPCPVIQAASTNKIYGAGEVTGTVCLDSMVDAYEAWVEAFRACGDFVCHVGKLAYAAGTLVGAVLKSSFKSSFKFSFKSSCKTLRAVAKTTVSMSIVATFMVDKARQAIETFALSLK